MAPFFEVTHTGSRDYDFVEQMVSINFQEDGENSIITIIDSNGNSHVIRYSAHNCRTFLVRVMHKILSDIGHILAEFYLTE